MRAAELSSSPAAKTEASEVEKDSVLGNPQYMPIAQRDADVGKAAVSESGRASDASDKLKMYTAIFAAPKPSNESGTFTTTSVSVMVKSVMRSGALK